MQTKVAKIARWILGLMYLAGGLVALLKLAPEQAMPGPAGDFAKAMMDTGYFFLVLKLTETICGASLLTGLAAPVSLVILAPVTLHIFFFHAFLTPGLGNLAVPVVIGVIHVVAASGYWSLYRPLFGCCQCGLKTKQTQPE